MEMSEPSGGAALRPAPDSTAHAGGISAAPAEERGFAVGALVVLRPVLESDLPELAGLLAANPFDPDPQPWTQQRLKKLYEGKDKEDAGLWSRQKRHFAVVRKTGGLVGFLRESDEWGMSICWNRIYIGEQHPDRDALGCDAVAAYLAYKRKWHNPRRISFDVLRDEPGVGAWLEAAGFECEIAFDNAALYHGQPAACCMYAWLSDEVRNNLADDGPVAGEEA